MQPHLVYFVTDLFRAGAAIENASRIHADSVSAVPLVADSRFRDVAREAIRTWPFCYGGGVRLDHDLVQNRGIGEEEIIIGSVARRFVNVGNAVWWYVGAKFFSRARLMAIYPRWRFYSPDLLEWLLFIAPWFC